MVHYRQFLDSYSDSLPYRTPVPTTAPPQKMTREAINDRYELHTKYCGSCKRALRNSQIGQVAALVGASIGAGMSLFSGIAFAARSGGSVGFSAAPLKIAAGRGLLGCVALLVLAKVMMHFIRLLTYTEISYNFSHAEEA